MTIKLLRFPSLIQILIFEEMDLLATLSITMLSKKSYATVKACLRHHKYHLEYFENHSLKLEREFAKEHGNILLLKLHDQNIFYMQSSYQWWRIGNQEVLIELTSTESYGKISTLVEINSGMIPNFATKTLQYLSRLLPKLSLTLKLKGQNVETFRRIMQSVESVKEIKKFSVVQPRDRVRVPQDELVEIVLDEFPRTKNLVLATLISDGFVYPTSVPFKYDSVIMFCTGWISRDYFIKLFLLCKKVELRTKDFDDADLTAIFKAWSEGSPLEILQFVGTHKFYQGKTLDIIFDEFPGAVSIRNAIIPTETFTESHVVTFGEGECFLIQQCDGQTKALVYIDSYTVMLSTNFQIGKEVDEVAARIEEERLLRQL